MNSANRNKWYAFSALALVIIVGLALHLIHINYPSSPVFDEVHFATYSADYVTGIPFEDIHPPLGKLIYASVLWFYPRSLLQNATFVNIIRMPDHFLLISTPKVDFGNFPYVSLRVLDSIFGILLALALYYLMRALDVGRVGATLAAIFVIFDNALLLSTRLIFLDGMFLFFGIASLALYFAAGKKRRPLLAGFFWGLSLGVKLTGIVFLGPAAAAVILAVAAPGARKHEWKQELRTAAKFALSGFAVLICIWFAGTLMFSPVARLDTLTSLMSLQGLPTPAWQASHPVATYVTADIFELIFSTSNYLGGLQTYQNASPWYFWPVDQLPMKFGNGLYLEGNPVLWFGSTLAIIFALALLYRYLKERFRGEASGPAAASGATAAKRPAFFILLGGYLASMFPFLTVVHRDTFIYHYFPALIFAFGLLAWFISEWLGVREWTDFRPRTAVMFCAVILVVIAGFLIAAPGTYGFAGL